MAERKRIYLCLAHMSESGLEQKYIKEAFDTNWENCDSWFMVKTVDSLSYKDSWFVPNRLNDGEWFMIKVHY